jgi:RNA polymerase sigma-70 factor (ECF subfamily)
MQNEADLIVALRRRDSAAFSFLFESYSDKLFRLALGMLGDEDEAEAIVQESFLRLFEKLDQFEGRAKLGTWLYRVAYNASIDQLRRRRPDQSLVEEPEVTATEAIMPVLFTDWSQAPETILASAEAQDELERAIAGLPERLRTTFVLREIEGLSTAETAEVLGLKPGAVKVQLHRARLLLREQLTAYFGERVILTQENS